MRRSIINGTVAENCLVSAARIVASADVSSTPILSLKLEQGLTKGHFKQTEGGLGFSGKRTQRLSNNRRCPNDVVLRPENVEYFKNE